MIFFALKNVYKCSLIFYFHEQLSSIPGLEVEASTVTETQTEKPAPKEEPEIEETPVLSIEVNNNRS